MTGNGNFVNLDILLEKWWTYFRRILAIMHYCALAVLKKMLVGAGKSRYQKSGLRGAIKKMKKKVCGARKPIAFTKS